jgi:hypothetical protein
MNTPTLIEAFTFTPVGLLLVCFLLWLVLINGLALRFFSMTLL